MDDGARPGLGTTPAPVTAPQGQRSDLLAVGALLAIYSVWGLLVLYRATYFCLADCAIENLPRLVAAARAIQGGSIPFWDPYTFAGAKPFWAGVGLYYPPLLPLYLLADTHDIERASIVLHLLPYVLHLAWAGVGGYLFGRRLLGLSLPGAMVTGLAYSFCPPMLIVGAVIIVQIYSYLPWIVLAAARFVDTGSARAWVGTVVLVALMASTSTPDYVSRIGFIVGLQVGLYWLLTASRAPRRSEVVRRFLGLALVAPMSVCLFAFGWAGFLEGILWIQGQSLTCAQVGAFAEGSSVDPRSLFGALFPALLANDATLGSMESFGSIGLGTLFLGAITLGLVSPSATEAIRRWKVIAVALTLTCLAIALGKFSPAFGWACRALPWFFGFPHPVYYTIGASWGAAILGGIGVSALAQHQRPRFAIGLVALPLIALWTVVLVRPEIPNFVWLPGGSRVIAYAAAVTLCVAGAIALPRRFSAAFLIACVVVETSFGAVRLALHLPSGAPIDWQINTKWTLANNSSTELKPMLESIAREDRWRFVGTRAFVDNQAWVVEGRSLFGISAKPLAPDFASAAFAFAFNPPYELWLEGLPWFLTNMNVGYIVADRHPTYREWMRAGCPHFSDGLAALPLAAQTESFDLRTLPEALPYVYFQDHIAASPPPDQLRHILGTDLRLAAFVRPDSGIGPTELATDGLLAAADVAPCEVSDPPLGRPYETSLPDRLMRLADFDALQRLNVVSRFDRSDPNRKVIRATVRRPSLLVVAETFHDGWRASIDGRSAPLHRVNALQQGVWLTEGDHVVELTFAPASLRNGLWVSALALVLLVAVARGQRRSAIRRQAAAIGEE